MLNRMARQAHVGADGISIAKKEIKGCFDTHWHEFYELEFILDGSGVYVIDGREYEIKKGMLFFMSPVNFHEVRTESAQIVNVMFSESVCSSEALFALTSEGTGNAFYFEDREFAFVSELFSEMIEEKADKVYLKALMDVLILKAARKNKSIAELTYVQSAMLYISNNFRGRLTLPQTAAHIGLSPSYLSALFPKEIGVTFKEYVSSLRFEYAKKLLIFSKQSVSEICYESGFEDYAGFMRNFKKRFKMPPGQFRKAERQQSELI